MCEAGKARFRFKQVPYKGVSLLQTGKAATAKTTAKTTTKTLTITAEDDKVSKKGDSDVDPSLCGIKCLTKPKVMYAPFIKGLINDYIRMQ